MTVPSQDWSLEASVFPINKAPGANFSTKDLKKNVTPEATENTPIAQDLSRPSSASSNHHQYASFLEHSIPCLTVDIINIQNLPPHNIPSVIGARVR